MAGIFFDDIIKVDKLNPDGKKFDKVSRVEASSEQHDMQMLLDVNTEIYPIREGEKFRMALAQTLTMEVKGTKTSLADKFEYVMYGLLYKMSEYKSGDEARPKVKALVSFGGLQLELTGEPSQMSDFKIDQRLYLLMRKV